MKHPQNNIWNKRLPRGLGALVLLFSLGTIFWLSRNAVLLGTKAAIGNIPKDIQISNIAKNSFTVSYTTDAAVTGSVSYGLDQNTGKVAFDKRDTATPLPHNIHYINITNLTPATKYLFSILSEDKIFKNGESFYEATTAPDSSSTASAQTKITGSVKLDGGSTPSEAIAYISAPDSQLFSTLVQPDGSYAFSVPFTLLPETVLKMRIVNQTLESNITFLTSQADPIPPVILSKDYDFSISPDPLASTTASESAQITGFPPPDETQTASGPQILSPKTDEEFKDQQPLFQGTAIPGNDVEITIESNHEITTTVQADASGNWEFRPQTELSPGDHTITVKTLNEQGILETLTRSFTVFAQGSQFVEPSVSPTVTPTGTATPSPTPIQSGPSPTLTSVPTVTMSPTLTPTPTIVVPTPTITAPPATPAPQITTPPIPNAGNSAVALGLTGISILIGIGSLLFFLL